MLPVSLSFHKYNTHTRTHSHTLRRTHAHTTTGGFTPFHPRRGTWLRNKYEGYGGLGRSVSVEFRYLRDVRPSHALFPKLNNELYQIYALSVSLETRFPLFPKLHISISCPYVLRVHVASHPQQQRFIALSLES